MYIPALPITLYTWDKYDLKPNPYNLQGHQSGGAAIKRGCKVPDGGSEGGAGGGRGGVCSTQPVGGWMAALLNAS